MSQPCDRCIQHRSVEKRASYDVTIGAKAIDEPKVGWSLCMRCRDELGVWFAKPRRSA